MFVEKGFVVPGTWVDNDPFAAPDDPGIFLPPIETVLEFEVEEEPNSQN